MLLSVLEGEKLRNERSRVNTWGLIARARGGSSPCHLLKVGGFQKGCE